MLRKEVREVGSGCGERSAWDRFIDVLRLDSVFLLAWASTTVDGVFAPSDASAFRCFRHRSCPKSENKKKHRKGNFTVLLHSNQDSGLQYWNETTKLLKHLS